VYQIAGRHIPNCIIVPLNPVNHTFISYLFKIHFNIILPSTRNCRKCSHVKYVRKKVAINAICFSLRCNLVGYYIHVARFDTIVLSSGVWKELLSMDCTDGLHKGCHLEGTCKLLINLITSYKIYVREVCHSSYVFKSEN
jgi:hypothetical protein